MKVASIIFTVLGVVLNFYNAMNYGSSLLWILALVGAAIGIGMIASMSKDSKYVGLGICGIIFTGLLGGIFYLCWNPENN